MVPGMKEGRRFREHLQVIGLREDGRVRSDRGLLLPKKGPMGEKISEVPVTGGGRFGSRVRETSIKKGRRRRPEKRKRHRGPLQH